MKGHFVIGVFLFRMIGENWD